MQLGGHPGALELEDGIDVCPPILFGSGEVEQGAHLALPDVVLGGHRARFYAGEARNLLLPLANPNLIHHDGSGDWSDMAKEEKFKQVFSEFEQEVETAIEEAYQAEGYVDDDGEPSEV